MLKLPQKTAAAVLGISESMLCKRFKEFTRRKWPYRQMQKLNATITQVRSMMVRDGRTPQLLHELEGALMGVYVWVCMRACMAHARSSGTARLGGMHDACAHPL